MIGSAITLPLRIPAVSKSRQLDILEKLHAAAIAEHNYYGSMFMAGAVTRQEWSDYEDTHDAILKAIRVKRTLINAV